MRIDHFIGGEVRDRAADFLLDLTFCHDRDRDPGVPTFCVPRRRDLPNEGGQILYDSTEYDFRQRQGPAPESPDLHPLRYREHHERDREPSH